ncbi:MAG TPA: pyridoxal-phosphate dependent enzyme [Polyangiaceae bacterium]
MTVEKLALARLPTPLERSDALDRLVGTAVWVKRDDLTAAGAAGNKIRKLEYLLADARRKRATVVVTCGGQQSNHARATAIVAAELGLRSLLLLRTANPAAPPPIVGNLLIDYLVGADVRFITPGQYRERDVLMAEAAEELRARGEVPYVVPEGGSNGLGSLGYVDAMSEVRRQLDAGACGTLREFDTVVHACGSGGTSAGVALGIARHGVGRTARSIAVCDDRAYFEPVIARIVEEASSLDASLDRSVRPMVHDEYKGPAYGLASAEQLAFIVEVARKTGLLLDPVYTGKALFGLSRFEPKPSSALFLHTGGLPGLLAQSEAFAPIVGPRH